MPLPGQDPSTGPYLKDFVTSYLTPTELYARIHQLAAEFPDLAEVVELPYTTNGRRHAQALLDPPGNRLVVDPPSPPPASTGRPGPTGFGPGLPPAGHVQARSPW